MPNHRSETPRTRRTHLVAVTVALAVSGAACGKDKETPPPPAPASAPAAQAPAATPQPVAKDRGPFQVVEIDLGRSIGPDNRVAEPTVVFGPRDTIYAAVATSGHASSVELKARWTYAGRQLLNETKRTIAPTGPTVTEFHIAKPEGWQAGSYQIEISVDGDVAKVKDFTVQ